jgi:PAS domain S-box-containing protein
MDPRVWTAVGASLKTPFDAAPCGIHVLDAQGRLLAVNETELRWLGYGRQDLSGLGMAEILPVESLRGFQRHFEALKKGEETGDIEVQLVRRDGTRMPALIAASALRDEAGRFLAALAIVYDLTERKKHEQEESARARELSQREFIANVSHEFRTPLAAILGFTETLREGAVDNPQFRGKFLATIERHAQRLLRLVDEVLDVSERDAGGKSPAFETFALQPLARRIARGLGPLSRRQRIRVSVSIPSGLAVRADPGQLEQVLQNLLGNALKYNRRGGRVRITARRADGRAVIAVRDTGIGIAGDELPYIFDRFHRSRDPEARERKGSGLGLAITKAIVRAHGGRIWAESRPGKGSAFFVSLPAAPASAIH